MNKLTLAEEVRLLEEDLAFWKRKSDAQGEMIVRLTTPTTYTTRDYLTDSLSVTVRIPRDFLYRSGVVGIMSTCRKLERDLIDSAVRGRK